MADFVCRHGAQHERWRDTLARLDSPLIWSKYRNTTPPHSIEVRGADPIKKAESVLSVPRNLAWTINRMVKASCGSARFSGLGARAGSRPELHTSFKPACLQIRAVSFPA
jgi:hypothetical protein